MPSPRLRPARRLISSGLICFLAPALSVILSGSVIFSGPVLAAGGSLTFRLEDESDASPVISRVEFFRGESIPQSRAKQMPIRNTVSAGIGVVVDRQVVLELPDGPYQFRITRGPEYRVLRGNFVLEKTSLDEKTVALPRMVDLLSEGWVSGDCCIVPSPNSLPLRMASEDLHVGAVLGDRPAKPIPRRESSEVIQHDPTWIRSDAVAHEGLVVYGIAEGSIDEKQNSLQLIASLASHADAESLRVGVEDPFAWELPVWLASRRVDGIFVLGNWLRLDRKVLKVRGRGLDSFSLGEATQVGRYAETIYRHVVDAGLDLVPLAGGGSGTAQTPVGYNRVYVTQPLETSAEVMQPTAPSSSQEWWNELWNGRSVVTNGPLLRPLVGGKLPGHVFQGRDGEVLRIQPELNLAVRDPVEYLEVIHNNRIHYNARLDEFARAGGVIPPIMAKESGWVMLRVLTEYQGHYRACITAPWWIEFDGQRRVSTESVEFFQSWLGDYEQRLRRLPPEELAKYVPFIQAARRFWNERAKLAR